MTTEHYEPGALVEVGPHTGRVMSVSIRPGAVLYEISYWHDGEYREVVAYSFMVTLADAKPAMGFPAKKKSV